MISCGFIGGIMFLFFEDGLINAEYIVSMQSNSEHETTMMISPDGGMAFKTTVAVAYEDIEKSIVKCNKL